MPAMALIDDRNINNNNNGEDGNRGVVASSTFK